jgi:hypothetical protein
MPPPPASPRPRFVPRVALLMAGGFLLFLLSTGLYVLPVLNEPAPPGAIADYHAERVRARLEGKVVWFLAGSLAGAALLGARLFRERQPTP